MPETQNGVYVGSSTKTGDMYLSRPAPDLTSTREQLPPLSSILASTDQTGLPPISYTDGHSPVFPAVSPNDPRQSDTTIHADRPFISSHFHRPAVARQYSHNSRPEVERLGIPPPPQHSQVGAGAESPLYNSRRPPVESSLSFARSLVNAWSPHSQSHRPEYFPTDTSSSFWPRSELRQPTVTNRPEMESRATYRDGRQSEPGTLTYPPTPTSKVTGDPLTANDWPGPMIWSRTQFIPKFVRSAEVPGHGMCYFYDNETHYKTVINSGIANTHGTVTEAGNPKKRLSTTAMACREKRINCDPDRPRCIQCEKLGRVCKFKNAPRGGHGPTIIPSSNPEDSVSRSTSPCAYLETLKVEKYKSSHAMFLRQGQQVLQATPDSEIHQPRKQRIRNNDFISVAFKASPRLSVHDPSSSIIPWTEPINNSLDNQSGLLAEWQTNPFSIHPMLIAELISVFFKHIPETAYNMFPEVPFKAWTLSVLEKSTDELMLVYTVLSLATVFSEKSVHKALGARFAAVARFACDNSRLTFQLVQSRVLLALYYFAINNAEDAWHFCGAALRSANGINLNLEIEKTEDAYLRTFPYGLTRAGFAECRRRTFWSCYLMDRYNGFCSGNVSIVQSYDVFVRFPCDVDSFESQLDIQNPFFDPATPPIQNINWTIGSIAYLINITTIWGDVMANIYRTSHRPSPSTIRENFAAFYKNATLRLRIWNDALPSCYVFSPENLARAASGGKLGIFMMMHTVYHTTAMKLNRYIQRYNLTDSRLTHHVTVSKQHAEGLLRVVDALATFKATVPSSPVMNGDTQTSISSPFVGYAIVSAIDILTAKVMVHSIASRLTSFQGCRAILAELAQFWHSSKDEYALIQQRVRDLGDLVQSKDGAAAPHIAAFARETGDGVFEMTEALEKTFSRDYDCIYT